MSDEDAVEGALLQAMKGIDYAVHFLADKEKYHQQIENLLDCKKQIKKLLNDDFDSLARHNAKYRNMKFS